MGMLLVDLSWWSMGDLDTCPDPEMEEQLVIAINCSNLPSSLSSDITSQCVSLSDHSLKVSVCGSGDGCLNTAAVLWTRVGEGGEVTTLAAELGLGSSSIVASLTDNNHCPQTYIHLTSAVQWLVSCLVMLVYV